MLSSLVGVPRSNPPGGVFYSKNKARKAQLVEVTGESTGTAKRALRRGTRATSAEVVHSYRAGGRPNCEKKIFEINKLFLDVVNVPLGTGPETDSIGVTVSLESLSGPGNSRAACSSQWALASEATFLTDMSQSGDDDDLDPFWPVSKRTGCCGSKRRKEGLLFHHHTERL